jgi:fucose 4-O-acetylase-like acetyltransferase
VPRGGRDPFLDNAKLILVALVVIGHSWTLADENYWTDRIYNWMYLWHLPVFVMVTGYLSRSFTFSRRHLERLVTTVLLPYLVFEGLIAIFRVVVGGERLEELWIDPHWPMWYLMALFLWRVATPVLRSVRPSVAVGVSLVVSLASGWFATDWLDLNRVMGLLPFFVLGLVARPEHLSRVRTAAVRWVGVAALVAAVPLAWFVESTLDTEWLYYRRSYAELEFGLVAGMSVRFLQLLATTVLCLGVIAWLPGRRLWFSRLGTSSLVVYLFHGFFVKGAEYAGFEDWAQGRGWESLALTTVGGTLVALVLAWRPVAKTLNTVIVPADAVPTPPTTTTVEKSDHGPPREEAARGRG